MNIEDSCISCIDTDWSYQLARRMEKEKTNPVLGYRTAGSAAETATGDMLYREMKAIGLTDVTRDTFSLDGWEFEKAVLKFTDDDGQEHTFQMGGYQTNFETDGFEDYELVYLGKGTAADYEGINVKGKLVMVEINQRDEWWISFPVYQAYLRGAAALIAVQANGYGEIAESALNAQDIAGPDFAPAFSLSQADARILKRSLRNKISACEDNTTDSEDTHNTLEQDATLLRRSSLKVSLDARSRVIPDTTARSYRRRSASNRDTRRFLLHTRPNSRRRYSIYRRFCTLSRGKRLLSVISNARIICIEIDSGDCPLPTSRCSRPIGRNYRRAVAGIGNSSYSLLSAYQPGRRPAGGDRKSTRLNSSHNVISRMPSSA